MDGKDNLEPIEKAPDGFDLGAVGVEAGEFVMYWFRRVWISSSAWTKMIPLIAVPTI